MKITNDHQAFRKAVKLMASLNLTLELITDAKGSIKMNSPTKGKLSMAEKALERDITKYIDKLYETDENIFSGLQEAYEHIIETKIEDLVNEYIRNSTQEQSD